MKKLNFDKAKVEYEKQIEGLRNGGKPLLVTIILTFLVMIAVCLAVFFGSVQGKEQVMVPNVIGKDLTTVEEEVNVFEIKDDSSSTLQIDDTYHEDEKYDSEIIR
jgi:hypothetical protein